MEGKFLPLGTIVKLKKAEDKKYLMVVGFCATKNEGGDEIYDYVGCTYPFGLLGNDINFLFNNDEIEQIIFKGFVDEQENEFKQELNSYMGSYGNNPQVNNEEDVATSDDNSTEGVVTSPEQPVNNIEIPLIAQQQNEKSSLEVFDIENWFISVFLEENNE